MKVLLTTTDYLPQIGGLSTFTQNLETVFKNINIDYDLFVYRKNSPKNFNEDDYDYFINVHFLSGSLFKLSQKRHINFYHGSEILFYSPNFFKRIYKKLFKFSYLNYFKQTYLNLFISDFTSSVLRDKGLHPDYSRDMILPNAIDIKGHSMIARSLLGDELNFICICRDVPHKNITGTYDFLKSLAKKIDRKINFFVTTNRQFPKSEKLQVVNILDCTDLEKVEYIKRAHFNLLFSLDHRHRGFYEGFGLTILEAGLFAVPSVVFNSGGLPEAVHHLQTGWVLSDEQIFNPLIWWDSLNEKSYQDISLACYDHTITSHSLLSYETFFRGVLK